MKRKIALILAMLLALSTLFSACGGEKTVKTSDRKEITLSGVNEFPIVEEPITLSIFAVKNAYIESFEDNDFTRLFEEKTNVHLDWNVVSGDQRQAFNLMLASGTYSDIIMEMGLTKSEMLTYASQGILTDISPYIEEHGYYIKNMFEETPAIKEAITLGGKIYGLPKVTESYRYEYPAKMWVYKPWIEKLGIAIPQNTDEFYNMLKEFKEKDPNGNGIADEIPLVARGVSGNAGIEPYLMCAFIPMAENTRFYVDEKGKVQCVAVQPEYREGLRYIKKLYDDGLLYSDTFILDRTQIMSIGENEPVILGAGTGMFPGMFTISNGNEERYYEYTAIPPIEGPKGVRATAKKVTNYTGNFLVSSTCKYPEVAIKWVDWLYSPEGKKLSQATTGGTSEKREARPGELGYDGQQALWAVDKVENKSTGDAGMAHNRSWQNFGVWHSNFEQSIKVCNYNDILDKHGEWYKAYEAYGPYGVGNMVGDLAIAESDLDAFTEAKTALEQIEAYFASFVIGEKSLDDDWDAYVENLNNLGLKTYLEILQKAYDASK